MDNKISKEIEDLISSKLFDDKITDASKKYDLNVDQSGELYAETIDVLKGVTPTSDYTKDLESRLEIPSDLAQKIAEEVGREVFDNIRTAMREMQENKEKEHLIGQIENPVSAPGSMPINILDHMLAGPTSQTTQVEVKKAPDTIPAGSALQISSATTPTPPSTPPPPVKTRPYSTDPYREPTI